MSALAIRAGMPNGRCDLTARRSYVASLITSPAPMPEIPCKLAHQPGASSPLVLLLAPEALNHSLRALALIAGALAATVVLAWLGRRLTGDPERGMRRSAG